VAAVYRGAVDRCNVEHFRSAGDRKGADRSRHYGFQRVRPLLHALYAQPLGVLCWSALAYAVCQFVPGLRGKRTGLVLAAAVFSHWILDLIVHRPDLTLYDSVGKMGFGLWNYRGAAFALEMAVLLCGAAMLYRTATHKVRLTGFVVFLAALQVFGTFFFPPPPSAHAAAISALVSYVVLALGAGWVD
jgi:hypothetical protein